METQRESSLTSAVACPSTDQRDGQQSQGQGVQAQTEAGARCEHCAGNGSESLGQNPFVYALGRIEARFPSISVEKEFAQVLAKTPVTGVTDRARFHALLSRAENRYLARQVCWVFRIEEVDTYILQPREPHELSFFIDALKIPERSADEVKDVDVVIGLRGPIAPIEMCNGLAVPIVVVDKTYSFILDDFITQLKEARGDASIPEEEYTNAAVVMFRRLHQITDNAGASDEHRALNYLAVRYNKIYDLAAERYHRNCTLTSVDVIPSRLSGLRRVVDVIFAYTNTQTDVVEKFFVRVDVSEEFPFLVSKLMPYYDR